MTDIPGLVKVDMLPPIPRVDVPSRIRKPEFKDGMLIARNVRRADTGEPEFGKVDSDWVEEMGQKRRHCQLCGLRIAKTDWCVFPGKFGLMKYQEAPLHTDCARSSLTHCPHILKNRGDFGVTVCLNYVVVEFAPPMWLDPGCVPTGDGVAKSKKKQLILSFAHDLHYENGKTVCKTCNGDSLQEMTWAEFMRWSR